MKPRFKIDAYLNIVLLGHVAPAGRVEEWIEPHCDDVAKYFGLDELPVQEAVEALSEEVSLPAQRREDLNLSSSSLPTNKTHVWFTYIQDLLQ